MNTLSKRLRFLSFGVSTFITIALIGCTHKIIETSSLPQESRTIGTIHVTGSGSVVGEPDIVTLNLGVSVEKKTVAAAREAAAAAMTGVIAALKANDIPEKDIRTDRFNIQPEYNHTDGKRVLRGYSVNNTVSAKVRALETLSEVIDNAAEAGGDIVVVHGIEFMIEDPTALQAQARSRAAKDAAARAQTLAEANGRTLGAPITITEGTSGNYSSSVRHSLRSLELAEAPSSTPIEAGELTITVNVTAVYEIE